MSRPLSNSVKQKLSASTDSSDDSGADDLQLALSQSIIGELPGAVMSHAGKSNNNTSQDSGVVESSADTVTTTASTDTASAHWPKGGSSRAIALDDRTPTQDTVDTSVFK